MQDVIKAACIKEDDETGLPPRLREAIIIMMAAAPKDSDLIRDVLAAIKHGLEVACSFSALPELVLNLLNLPGFCQVYLCKIMFAKAFLPEYSGH